MAERTISRVYDHYNDAVAAVQALEAADIPHRDISLIGPHGAGGAGTPDAADSATGAGAGATVGTVLGGGAGLLAGLGALAIPGVGPIVAAGWLVAAFTGAGVGAAAGGVLGSLTGAGVPEEDAHVYAESLRRGSSLVSVRVPNDTRGAEVERILDQRSPVNVGLRRGEYQTAGWTGFDENAGPYSPGASRSQIP